MACVGREREEGERGKGKRKEKRVGGRRKNIFKIKVENDVKEEDEARGGAAATEARERYLGAVDEYVRTDCSHHATSK